VKPSSKQSSCSVYSSTVNMEKICSSETSDEFHGTRRRHIPEDSTFHTHRRENFKSYKLNNSSILIITITLLVYAEFEVLSLNSPGGTEKTHKGTQ
jgi:hypothetical protein